MRISVSILCIFLSPGGNNLFNNGGVGVALARSSGSGRSSSGAPRRSGGSSSRGGGGARSSSAPKRRRDARDILDDEEEDSTFGIDEDEGDADEYDDNGYDDEEEDFGRDRRRPPSRGRRDAGRGPPPSSRRAAPRFDDYDEDDYDDEEFSRGPRGGRGPPPSSRGDRGGRARDARGVSSRGRGPDRYDRDYGRRGPEGRMVSYNQSRRRGPPPPPVPSTFTRGLSAIRDRMPDPTAVKDSITSAASLAQEKTSQLSSNIYREVKGLTSSELEQVMLKATRPDDVPVKSKHVERLVGVTYQISGKYDIYDAVLRKLWNKMAEKDMRTKLKSVYVLHRFSVDGGPDHQEALKQRLRALRKTKDPKRKGSRYFDSKVLMGTDAASPDAQDFRAFLSRYAHYVLTRAQTFGGVFNEISLANAPSPAAPPSKKSRSKGGSSRSKGGSSGSSGAGKPKNPPLSEEHLKYAQMVLKAGLACTLHDGEESESTAMCVERVAADLMGLTAAVAVALKRELKQDGGVCESDPALVKQWCQFYSEELLPDTKKFVKKATPKLDAYGLYLPSRMSASLPQELLEKGLKMESDVDGGVDEDGDDDVEEKDEKETDGSGVQKARESSKNDDNGASKLEDDADEGDVSIAMSANKGADNVSTQEDEYDEYEYDEYDEYDEE